MAPTPTSQLLTLRGGRAPPKSTSIHSAYLETAVHKVQSGLLDRLTGMERRALQNSEELPPVEGVSEEELREARMMAEMAGEQGIVLGDREEDEVEEEEEEEDCEAAFNGMFGEGDEEDDEEVEILEPAPRVRSVEDALAVIVYEDGEVVVGEDVLFFNPRDEDGETEVCLLEERLYYVDDQGMLWSGR